MPDPAFRLPDEDKPDIRPHLRGLEGGGEDSGPPRGNLHSVPAPEEGDGAGSGASGLGQQETSAAGTGRHLRAVPDTKDDTDKSADSKFNPDGDKDSGDKKPLLKRLATKKNAKRAGIGGLLGGTLFGGVFGLSTIISGPAQILQWGEMLKNLHSGVTRMVSDNRAGRQLLYALAGQSERGRLGHLDNWLADRYEKRLNNEAGLRSIYDKLTGRLVGYEVLDEYKAYDFSKDMPDLKTVSTDSLVDSSGTKVSEGGHRIISVRDDNFKTRRLVTKLAMKNIGTSKVGQFIGSRLLTKRGGVGFHPLNKLSQKKDETLEKFRQRVEKEQADNVSGEKNVGGIDTPEKKDARTKFAEIKGQLQEFIKSAKGPLIVVGALCGLRTFSQAIDAQNLNNMETAMRMGMQSVNEASQVESMNDFSSEQLGVISDSLYDPATKTSVTADPGVQYENGDQQTGFDYISKVRPTAGNQKPWFFDAVDTITGPIAPVCGLISDTTQAISNVIGIKQALALIQGTLNFFAKTISGKSIDEWVKAGVDYFSTAAVDTAARGAAKGGIENMGVRWAMNDQMLAMGGRALSSAEEQTVHDAALEQRKQEFASASFYDRYLNLKEPGSALGSLALAFPRSQSQLFATIQQLPTQLADMLSKSFGFGKAFAASTGTYDYGFPLIGFSMDEMNSGQYANPFDNEAYMLQGDRLQRMNDEYGKDCFYMTVAQDGTLQNQTAGDFTTRPDKCNDTSNVELTHYRFYLADLIVANQNACYEGDDDACKQLGFGTPPATPQNTTPSDPSAIGDPYAASDTMTCSVGTDNGVQDGYHNGTLVKIRICNVQGIQVNARIAANVDALLNAARAAGVNFTGGGFRTQAAQIQARKNNNCPDIYSAPASSCSPPTAPPGWSDHQMGEAIDFVLNGGIIQKGSTGYNWLTANAAKYGLKNLPTEAWHWSVDGS